MSSIAYLLPWILVLLAIGLACANKFLPFKSLAGIIVLSVLTLLMIGIAVYDNLISAEFEEQVAAAEMDLAAMEEWKYLHMDELSLIIAQQKQPEEEDIALAKQLLSYGWTRNTASFQRIADAAMELERLKAGRPDAERAIYLYKGIPQNVDRQIVELSLRRLGYKVIPPQEDEDPLEKANVLYFGKYVKVEDVKLTALTLMRAGIVLTTIKPFNKDTRGNLRAAKLEWNEYLAKRPPVTPQEVVEAQNFK